MPPAMFFYFFADRFGWTLEEYNQHPYGYLRHGAIWITEMRAFEYERDAGVRFSEQVPPWLDEPDSDNEGIEETYQTEPQGMEIVSQEEFNRRMNEAAQSWQPLPQEEQDRLFQEDLERALKRRQYQY